MYTYMYMCKRNKRQFTLYLLVSAADHLTFGNLFGFLVVLLV